MKLLLIGSRPDTSSTLALEREISALQRRLLDLSSEPIEFINIPDQRADDLSFTLGRIEPDVLHITAHGETSHLMLADSGGTAVKMTPKHLTGLLSPTRPPRLIYFSGCKSAGIAKGVTSSVRAAIGAVGTIGNGAARATAVSFYERALAGESVGAAFAAAEAMAATLGDVALELHMQPGVDLLREVLLPRPRPVVRFARVQQDSGGAFPIRVGVAHCPRSTTQLVVFLEGERAPCVSTPPEWKDETAWVQGELRIDADRHIFVVGLISRSKPFVAQARLSEAVTDSEQDDVRWALRRLACRPARPASRRGGGS